MKRFNSMLHFANFDRKYSTRFARKLYKIFIDLRENALPKGWAEDIITAVDVQYKRNLNEFYNELVEVSFGNVQEFLKEHQLDISNDSIRYSVYQAINQRGASLITNMVELEKEKLTYLMEYLGHEMSYADIAKEYRNYIGLTKPQMERLLKMEKELKEEGLAESKIQKTLERASKKMLRHRSLVIARTEMAYSYSTAQNTHFSYYQTQSGKQINKIWRVSPDDLTCEICINLDGEKVNVNEAFSTGVSGPPAHPSCYTEGHKVFTLEGWKDFDEVEEGEWVWSLNPQTLEMEPAKVTCKIKYWYNGDVYHLHNRWFDMKVTPEHSMWILTKYRKTLREVKPGELLDHMQIPRTAKWQGIEPKTITFGGLEFETEDFVRFMAWYLAEGNVSVRTAWKHAKDKERTIKHEIKITQVHNQERQYVFELAKRVFGKYGKIWQGREAVYIRSKMLDNFAEELHKLGYSYEKHIPDVIKHLSPRLLRIFINEYAKGDGHVRKARPYKGGNFKHEITIFTSSKRMANDLAEIILKAGWQFSWYNPLPNKKQQFKNGIYEIKHQVYRLIVKRSKKAYVKKLKIEKEHYEGLVYDVELEKNHVLLVMYNGKIAWSGNCRCYLIYEVED